MVQREIIAEVKDGGLFSVLADETEDLKKRNEYL